MRKLLLPVMCLALLLCSCSTGQRNTIDNENPWPTHAPEATPYVRLQMESPPELTEHEEYESYEKLLRSLYSQEAKFFFKEEELKMFRELPQDESYSFVPHLEPDWSSDERLPNNDEELKRLSMELAVEADGDAETDKAKELAQKLSERVDELELYSEKHFRIQEEVQFEYCIKTAQAFADKGCKAEVMSMKSLENGVEYNYYTTVIKATPKQLFDISDEMDNMFFIEQLFPTVEERFEETVWSSEG